MKKPTKPEKSQKIKEIILTNVTVMKSAGWQPDNLAPENPMEDNIMPGNHLTIYQQPMYHKINSSSLCLPFLYCRKDLGRRKWRRVEAMKNCATQFAVCGSCRNVGW